MENQLNGEEYYKQLRGFISSCIGEIKRKTAKGIACEKTKEELKRYSLYQKKYNVEKNGVKFNKEDYIYDLKTKHYRYKREGEV